LRISTRKPFKLKRRPGIKTLVMNQDGPEGQLMGAVLAKSTHVALFHGLARAHFWQWLLDTGEVKSGSEIAQLEGLDPSTVNELLRLTLLDPALVMDILGGKSPHEANMMWFTRNALPDLWREQFMPQQAA
ncbi:MAG: hypothetical protein ACKO0Z_28785, partial [Betaproteobacteria bacterium]